MFLYDNEITHVDENEDNFIKLCVLSFFFSYYSEAFDVYCFINIYSSSIVEGGNLSMISWWWSRQNIKMNLE